MTVKSVRFVMPRDTVVASTMGLSIEFKKGELVSVPSYMHQEVIARGGVPETELTEDELKDAEKVHGPTDADSRKLAIWDAYEKMALENKRDNFTAGGSPHLAPIAEILGWSITAKERDSTWAEFQVETKAK